MKPAHLFMGVTLLLGITMIISEMFDLERTSQLMRAFFVPMFALLYFLKRKFKNVYFATFVLLFALGEFTFLLASFALPYVYFLATMSFITAYAFMLIYILKSFSVKRLLKKFPFHMIVLLCFGTYVFLELDKTLGYTFEDTDSLFEYMMESAYNIMIISVFSMSFMYYLYFDTKLSLTFFLAFVFIALSEMLQIGYYFISSDNKFSILYSTFLVLGFYFLYKFIITEKIESNRLI